jgi:hypothetical protein
VDERRQSRLGLDDRAIYSIDERDYLQAVAVVASYSSAMPAQALRDMIEGTCVFAQTGDEATSHW